MKHLFRFIKKIFSMPKKFLIPLILLIVIGGFFLFRPQNKTPVLQYASVKKMDIKSTVSSSGTLTGKNVVDLKFRSAGKIAYLNIKVGDQVFKGQFIGGLDVQDLSIKLQQAQNTLRDKQAIAQKAEDDVKDHSSDESFAQKVTRTTAQATRDSAFDAVKEAERAFQEAVITSPIEGTVTQAPLIVGQTITSTDLVAQVVDFSSFTFNTDIDEADIGKVSMGQKADVVIDAFTDKTLTGTIFEIIPQTQTTSSGATVITVKIDLGKLDIIPINGLSGQSSIILAEVPSALTIPLEALRDDNSVVVSGNTGLIAEKVVPGIQSDTDVEIKSGLKEGDRVVLNPPANIAGVTRSQNPLNNITRFLRIGGGGGGGFTGGQRSNGGR